MPFVFPSASRSLFSRLAGALLLLAAGAARADAVPDLYRTAVPVTEQSPAEFKRAAALGMSEVLVRVSGRAEAAAQSTLREPIANADRYIEQYRYERATDGGILLQVEFAPATINTLLRGAGLMDRNVTTASRQALQLRVDGVESFADYAALLGYLNGMGTVTAVPQMVEGGAVTLWLQIDSDTEQLQQRLAIDRRLQPEASTSDAVATALHYRWQGRGG